VLSSSSQSSTPRILLPSWFCVLTIVCRAILRLLILRITHRPVLTYPVPERDFDPATLPPSSESSSPTLAPSSLPSSIPSTPEHLKNNHIPLPIHPLITQPPPPTNQAPIEEYLLSKALLPSSVKVPTSLLKTLSSPKDWMGEALCILRPLIYGRCLSAAFNSLSRLMIVCCSSYHAF
jgi:peroxin-16